MLFKRQNPVAKIFIVHHFQSFKRYLLTLTHLIPMSTEHAQEYSSDEPPLEIELVLPPPSASTPPRFPNFLPQSLSEGVGLRVSPFDQTYGSDRDGSTSSQVASPTSTSSLTSLTSIIQSEYRTIRAADKRTRDREYTRRIRLQSKQAFKELQDRNADLEHENKELREKIRGYQGRSEVWH